MNAQSKEKLRLIKAKKKMLNLKQVGVIVTDQKMNPAEFIPVKAQVVKARPEGILIFG